MKYRHKDAQWMGKSSKKKKKESIICEAISHSLQFSRSTAEIDCLSNDAY